MWPALNRGGVAVEVMPGCYQLPRWTEEERLISCSPWQLTWQEQHRRGFYVRRRAFAKGWIAFFRVILNQTYRGLVGEPSCCGPRYTWSKDRKELLRVRYYQRNFAPWILQPILKRIHNFLKWNPVLERLGIKVYRWL